MIEHVLIPVWSSKGWRGGEEVEVRALGGGRYEVVCPPRFAYGLAVGDEIALAPDLPCGFRTLRRSGNLTLWIYVPAEQAAALAESARAPLERLRATLEGTPPGMAIITAPLSAGWPAIEGTLQALVAAHPPSSWEFANVFDPATGAPLNWW